MHTFTTLPALCAATALLLGIGGCGAHFDRPLPTAGISAKAKDAQPAAAPDALDVYIGERFSNAQKALANKHDEEPPAPSF